MNYHNSKTVNYSFEETLEKLQTKLKESGFGIVTELDVKQTFKNKLNVDFRNYKILGACNPKIAHKGISMEKNLGVLLPCNVVVQEHEPGKVEVSFVNPTSSLSNVNNPELESIAGEVSVGLNKALEQL